MWMEEIEMTDGDESDFGEEDLNHLLNVNEVDQGYFVAMFLQRIIASGEMNVIQSVREPHYHRTKLPAIRQAPVLKKLRRNFIYQAVQQASGHQMPLLRPKVLRFASEVTIIPETLPLVAAAVEAAALVAAAAAKKAAAAEARVSAIMSSARITSRMPSLLHLVTRRERGIGLKHASFTEPQRCRLNNMHTPNTHRQLMNLASKVYCGAMSANGEHFVTASQDMVLRVFDAGGGSYARTNRIAAKDVHWGILDVAFTAKADAFVYSTWSTYLHMVPIGGDVNDIQSLDLQPATSRFCIFSLAFSACDQHVIGGSNDGCVYLYDRKLNARTLRVPVVYKSRSILEESSDVNTVGFLDETSNIIYTGLDNGAIRIWDRRTMDDSRYEPVGYFIGHGDGVTHIDSKRDGRYLISNSKDQTIKLWDMRMLARSNQERFAIRSRQSSRNRLSWDYRWDEVPSEFYDSSVPMRNDNSIMTYRGHRVRKSLLRAKFSPTETTGQRYIYTGCSTGHLLIYDLLTGKLVRTIDGHRDIVRDVAWHPSRQEILSSSWDGTVNLNYYAEPGVDPEGQRRAAERRSRRAHILLNSSHVSSLSRRSVLRRSQRIAAQRARLAED